ncbi:MAG: nucleotidyltransferase family protein [Pseudomonadota bacterium]
MAVILAAGLSRRMGDQNKLLLPVWGEPMIRRTVRAYAGAGLEVMVVTGFAARDITHAITDLPVRFVHNPDFERGQKTSVAAGLKAARGADDVLVGLGDQPRLGPLQIKNLINAHSAAGGGKISIPHDGDRRGNPIAIPGALIDALLSDQQNPGCHTFTRTRPELVNAIPLTDPAYYSDVDTPEAYSDLLRAGSIEAGAT